MERKKKLAGRRRSLSRRHKELPDELKSSPRPKRSRSGLRRRKIRKPRTTVYGKLGDLIRDRKGPETLKVSFLDIEAVLGRPLPSSARKYKAWWANNRSAKATSRHSRAWMDQGYLVSDVDFQKGYVVFSRVRGQRHALPYAAMLIESARHLEEGGSVPFTRKALFAEVAHRHPKALIHNQALNPVIQAMTESSKSSRMVAERWRGVFSRVSRGQYQLSQRGKTLDLQARRPIKVRGKTVRTRLRYYLQATRGWDLDTGRLKAGKNFPEIPFDLVARDGSVAVRILRSRVQRGKDQGLGAIMEALFALDKVPAKKKLLVLEDRSSRNRERGIDSLILSLSGLCRNVEVMKYVVGSKPDKDHLISIK